MSAFPVGVHYDLPIVDGDAMGRAFPTLYHCESGSCTSCLRNAVS